jgi:hypothetical protein
MSTLQTHTNTPDWELEFIRTGQIDLVPVDDQERVLHELNELCELARLVQGSL